MEFVDEESKVASEKLAEQRGTFAEWERSIWAPTRPPPATPRRAHPPTRGCATATSRPWRRRHDFDHRGVLVGDRATLRRGVHAEPGGCLMPDVNEEFVAIAKREGWYSETLMTQIAEAGHIHFDAVPAKWQRVFVTAHDVTPSRTSRCRPRSRTSPIRRSPRPATSERRTEDDVEQIYRMAFRLGCKA